MDFRPELRSRPKPLESSNSRVEAKELMFSELSDRFVKVQTKKAGGGGGEKKKVGMTNLDSC